MRSENQSNEIFSANVGKQLPNLKLKTVNYWRTEIVAQNLSIPKFLSNWKVLKKKTNGN